MPVVYHVHGVIAHGECFPDPLRGETHEIRPLHVTTIFHRPQRAGRDRSLGFVSLQRGGLLRLRQRLPDAEEPRRKARRDARRFPGLSFAGCTFELGVGSGSFGIF
jgi:hypothetical protein